jgi:putative intracellular protease/amidase
MPSDASGPAFFDLDGTLVYSVYQHVLAWRQALERGDVVRDKDITGYPACGPEVKQAGGRWTDIALDQAIADEGLVTAPAWPAHPA